MIDHRTRFVLGVIAVALCAIAFRSWLPVPGAEAQTPAKPPEPPKPMKTAYEFLEVERGGTDGIYQLKDKLDDMASNGWRATSIAITDNATVILLEKME